MRYSTADTGPQVEPNESLGSPFLFQTRSEHPQREHVEREMRQPRVDEHVRDDRPPVGGETRWIEGECGIDGVRPEQRELQEINADVQRQQPLNGARYARRIR